MSDDKPKTYDMQTAAKYTGLTPSVLRVWESRYGWPCPKRHRNGYRVFTQFEVDQIKKVADLVAAGAKVSELIRDGMPHLPCDVPVVHTRPDRLAKAVPRPTNREAHAARLRVEEYCGNLDVPGLRQEIAEAVRLRPADRQVAVYVPVVAFLIETEVHNVAVHGREALIEGLRAAIGQDALDACRDAVQCHLNLSPAGA